MAVFKKILLASLLILEVVVCYPNPNGEGFRKQSYDTDDNKSSNPITNIQNMLKSASTMVRNIISVHERVATEVLPVVQSAGETVQTLYKSGTIQAGAKVAMTVADNINNVVTMVVKTGERAVPIVNQVSSTVNEVAPLVKIAMCTLICPLQTDDEREKCRQENCTNRRT